MTENLKALPVWHEGERFIQQKVGVAERMAIVGQRVIRDHMPGQHRDFYAQLPFIVLGSVELRRRLGDLPRRASPGFMSSPSPTALEYRGRERSQRPRERRYGEGGPSAFLAWRCTPGAATA